MALATTPGWALVDGAVERTFRFKDFKEALAFVNRVGAVAEEWEHHPDIVWHWNEVKLRLWTHSEKGVTEWDTGLAAEISRL